jgi:nucleoside 2-deoxyribosyltransferase
VVGSGGVLQLRVGNQAASFAPTKAAELPAADAEPATVNVANVRDRAAQSGTVVEAFELALTLQDRLM